MLSILLQNFKTFGQQPIPLFFCQKLANEIKLLSLVPLYFYHFSENQYGTVLQPIILHSFYFVEFAIRNNSLKVILDQAVFVKSLGLPLFLLFRVRTCHEQQLKCFIEKVFLLDIEICQIARFAPLFQYFLKFFSIMPIKI